MIKKRKKFPLNINSILTLFHKKVLQITTIITRQNIPYSTDAYTLHIWCETRFVWHDYTYIYTYISTSFFLFYFSLFFFLKSSLFFFFPIIHAHHVSPRRENTPSFICNAYITFVVYFRTNAITWRLTSSSSLPRPSPTLPSMRFVRI